MYSMKENRSLRVAILDLYQGQANQGMRCIRELLNQYSEAHHIEVHWDEFEVRLSREVPDLSYDVYISSGGPGSPLESIDSAWEEAYFGWLNSVEDFNEKMGNHFKKQVLFICHSFQLACRHYKIGNVTRRKSTAFGVFPVHVLSDGKNEPVFTGLKDPFYAVDSRDYQVIQAADETLQQMGGAVLAIEKDRPHVPYERAIMAVRFNDAMIGTQFHPEADAVGMTMYLQRDDKKEMVITEHGEEKWKSMIEHLNDPDKILWTYAHVIPNFLMIAVEQFLAEPV